MGRGTVGKTALVGVKDRKSNRVSAAPVSDTDAATLKEFVAKRVIDGATIYTDGHRAYRGLPNHQAVQHSVGEYVRESAHTNGIDSFWAMLKRLHKSSESILGVYHQMSLKHLHRYITEFVGRHNLRA